MDQQPSAHSPRPVRPNTPPPTGFELNRPTLIALIYISVFITGPISIAGVVLAYIWRHEPHEGWQTSHFTYLIRTFWIGVLMTVAAIALIAIGIAAAQPSDTPSPYVVINVLAALLTLFVGFVWMLVRSVRSMARAQRHEPI